MRFPPKNPRRPKSANPRRPRTARPRNAAAVVRDAQKGAALTAELSAQHDNVRNGGQVRLAMCDLSSHSSIREFAARWGDAPVDLLCNNAAVTPAERTTTADGIETQWSVNVLSYHWLVKEFAPALLRSRHAALPRVCFVASRYAGDLDMSDPEFKTRPYDPNTSYKASKQANRILAAAWAERFQDRVLSTSCHPGVATSSVSLGLGFDIDRSVEAQIAGARTPLFCLLAPREQLRNGGYYVDSAAAPCSFTTPESVRALWDLVESYP